MGGKLFAHVVASARLQKKNFNHPDKAPTYNQKVFRLDGCMEMAISFADKVMKTTVYVKMDAPDQLLLSENVCRQLGIANYHPSPLSQGAPETTAKEPGLVPSVPVCILQSLTLPPGKSAVVSIQAETQLHTLQLNQTMMVNRLEWLEREAGVVVEEALLSPLENGLTHLMITNLLGFTRTVTSGTPLGTAQPVDIFWKMTSLKCLVKT